jgi:hypothetical protein
LKSPPPVSGSSELDIFETSVKRLHAFADFSGMKPNQFFTVTEVSSITRDEQGLAIYGRMQLSRSGTYIIKSRAEYELKVHVFALDGGSTRTVKDVTINIESQNKIVEFPQGRSREIDSEYEVSAHPI